jgi:hypothetical protein
MRCCLPPFSALGPCLVEPSSEPLTPLCFWLRRMQGESKGGDSSGQSGWQGVVAGRPVLDVAFNPSQPHVLLTVLGPSSSSGSSSSTDAAGGLGARSVVAVWDAVLAAMQRAQGPSKVRAIVTRICRGW